LTVTGIALPPLDATLVINNDDSITGPPNAGFASTDKVTCEIEDGFGGTNTAIVTICVVNEAPVALDDACCVDLDTTLAIASPAVLANESDADGAS
jgi:hypothetical protein